MFKPIITLGLLLSGGVALAAGAPQAVGINSAILGEVRTSSTAAPQPRPAVLRARIALADRVQTGARSQSLLWNLYRRDTTTEASKTSTLFGLVQHSSSAEGGRWRLFYWPVKKSAAAP